MHTHVSRIAIILVTAVLALAVIPAAPVPAAASAEAISPTHASGADAVLPPNLLTAETSVARQMPVPGVCDFLSGEWRSLCELFLVQVQGSEVDWEAAILICQDNGHDTFFEEGPEGISFRCSVRE